MFLADLHIHSTFSDGEMTIPQIVDFYGVRQFGCIAITDHLCESNTIMGIAARCMSITLTQANFGDYLRTIEEESIRAWEQYNMVVIPGFELTKNTFSNHRSAHILGLGIDRFQSAHGDVLDLIRGIKGQGGLAVAAHPVMTYKTELQTLHLWDRREELAEEVDAWEVASGDKIFEEVAGSGLPLLANSDLHRARQINSWKTIFRCERKAEAILQAIRMQQLDFHFYRDPLKARSLQTLSDASGLFSLQTT
ncbi:MAG: hypothetical protein AB7F86_05880 [Bdellovibrionales bacterium]